MGKYYSEHELLNNMYDIVDEDGCILTVLDKDTLKTLPPLMPVRVHAHWVRMYNNDGLCSNCDNILDEGTDLNDIRYCSWCGAKMDEAEIIGKRLIDGFIDGIGDNAKSVGQKFINNDENTVEHTIMGMKTEVTDETS